MQQHHTGAGGHSKLYTLASVFNEKAPPDYTKISALYPQRQQDESYRYKPAGAGGGSIVVVSPQTSSSQGSVSIPVSIQRRITAASAPGGVGVSVGLSGGGGVLVSGPIMPGAGGVVGVVGDPAAVAAAAAAVSAAGGVGGVGSGLMTMSLYDGVTSSGELVTNYLDANSGGPRDQLDQTDQEPACFRCHRCLPAGLALQLAALNAFFHPYCFLCYQCQTPLTQTSSFYHAAGRLLCEGCVNDALEMCDVCRQPVTERILRALGKPYHPACFRCTQCRRKLDGQGFTVDVHNRILCLDDFHRKYAPRCAACRQPITPARGQTETRRVLVDNQSYHVSCYHGSSLA